MKFRLVFLILIFSFSFANASGNDTALLYKQSLEQIKSLSAYLNSKPNERLTFSSLDTNSFIWKIYDTAFSLFFDKHIMDSLFQINQQVLQVSAKYKTQKVFLAAYDNLIVSVSFDSIQFKASHEASNSAGNDNDRYFRRNTIFLYFLIDKKEYEVYGFFFC